MRAKLSEERGQMMVELCAVIPVCLIIAAIVMNAIVFFGDCAAFDRAARNAVRTVAASPADNETTDGMAAQVCALVQQELGEAEVSCTVQGGRAGGGAGATSLGYTTFELVLSYDPTLFGLPLRGSVLGVALPVLEHATSLTVDSYTPGKLLE